MKSLKPLHSVFEQQLKAVPNVLLTKLIQRKIRESGVEISTEHAQAITKHLFSSKDEPFRLENGDDRNVSISISEFDLKNLAKETQDFMANKLPGLVATLTTDSSKLIFRTLKTRWPDQWKWESALFWDFSENLEARWGNASMRLTLLFKLRFRFLARILALMTLLR
jgi:hypothetical protein